MKLFRKLFIVIMCCAVSWPYSVLAYQDSSAVNIVLFGDSMIAGTGLPIKARLAALLQENYEREGVKVNVINSGVDNMDSGEGLKRVDELVLSHNPDVVLMQLGRIDLYKKVDIEKIRYNLEKIIWKILNKNRYTKIVLIGHKSRAGVKDKIYPARYNNLFPAVAGKYKVSFYEMYTKDIAGLNGFLQLDRMHPNYAGTKFILKRLLPYINKDVRDIYAEKASMSE